MNQIDLAFWDIVRNLKREEELKIRLPRNDWVWALLILGCILFWVLVAAGAGLLVTKDW